MPDHKTKKEVCWGCFTRYEPASRKRKRDKSRDDLVQISQTKEEGENVCGASPVASQDREARVKTGKEYRKDQ